MSTWKSFLTFFSVLLALMGANCQKKANLEDEKATIKNVILQQSKAARERSLTGEEAVWAHVPYAYRRVNSNYKASWDSISTWYKRAFANNTQTAEDYKEYWQNWDIRVLGQMAWAAYDQLMVAGRDTFTFREFRFLEKKENQWKLILQQTDFLGFFADTRWSNLEKELNNIGYALLQINKFPEAIKVFKMNTEFFPESSNVYDSLGDAYMAANDKQNAINYFKKAVEKDPKNKLSADKLKKLL
jgi:tetratricopeptide (TPR) repeat protein